MDAYPFVKNILFGTYPTIALILQPIICSGCADRLHALFFIFFQVESTGWLFTRGDS